MRRIRDIYISVLLCMMVMIFSCSGNPTKPNATEPGLILKIVEKNISVNVGDTITQSVNIEGVEDLFGSAIKLNFDENILEPVSIYQGQLFPVDNTIFFSDMYESVENRKKGYISFAVSRIRGAETVNGSGSLSRITFRVCASGSTGVMFDTIKLIKSDGEDLDGLNKIEVKDSFVIASISQ